ncbi:MAG: PfkB family carbohydrate kinase [Bacteroidia bacterium]
MRLVVAGTMALDTIETPYGRAEKIVGGAATYIALAAGYFTSVGVVSVIGYDYPVAMWEALEQKGVDLLGVKRILDRPSFFWEGKYNYDLSQRQTLNTQLNVLDSFPDAMPPSYQEVPYLLLGNLDPRLQYDLWRQCKAQPVVLVDTMNYWLDNARAQVEKVFEIATIVCINDEEARQFSGVPSLKKAARIILGYGPKYLIIKKGENGALLFCEEGTYFFPALPLEEVFDPTGAGDTFAGAIMGYLASQGKVDLPTLRHAIAYATVLSSLCVESFGVENLLHLSPQEVQQRYEQLSQMMQPLGVPLS